MRTHHFGRRAGNHSIMGGFIEFYKVTVTLAEAIAWPAAVAIAAGYFRNDISILIRSLKSVRYGDYEAIFDGLSAAASASKRLEISDQVENNVETNEYAPYRTIAERQPRTAIKQSHDRLMLKLEALMNAVWDKKHPDGKITMSGVVYQREFWPQGVKELALKDSKWLSDAEFSMLRSLEETKNLALNISSQNISYIVASEFIDLCQKLDASITVKLKSVENKSAQEKA